MRYRKEPVRTGDALRKGNPDSCLIGEKYAGAEDGRAGRGTNYYFSAARRVRAVSACGLEG